MPTKVFKVDYSHYTLVQNTLLGSDMLVGGCCMGPKMAISNYHFTPYAMTPYVCRHRRRILRSMTPNRVRGVMFMLSIASWNFWLGSNRLVRGICIGSKLASYCHIETHREPMPWPPPSCPLDNEAILWHLGADMMCIHFILFGYTYMEWNYAKKSNMWIRV